LWIKIEVNPPNEALSDYSKALGAMCKSFCYCEFCYVKRCFFILTGSNSELPSCFIRIDVAHMIKIFYRLKRLDEMKNKHLKEFYVR